MNPKALIIGAAGQDGVLLSKLLAQKNYSITGIRRGDIDLSQKGQVLDLLDRVKPSEIYYLAAQHRSSEVIESGDFAAKCKLINVEGPKTFLLALSESFIATRFFYASSSQIFVPGLLLNESSPFNAIDVYTETKIAGTEMCRRYREENGVFASVGILFNHESHLRKSVFLSKKIVSTAVQIYRGKDVSLKLGNLENEVDWGAAEDFVEGMWRALQAPTANDYVFATGISHTVRDFVQAVFLELGLNYKNYTQVDSSIGLRPHDLRTGDFTRARNDLGWKPSITFSQMITNLVAFELKSNSK